MLNVYDENIQIKREADDVFEQPICSMVPVGNTFAKRTSGRRWTWFEVRDCHVGMPMVPDASATFAPSVRIELTVIEIGA